MDAQKETLMEDAELMALMAELNEDVAAAVIKETPAIASKPVIPVSIPEAIPVPEVMEIPVSIPVLIPVSEAIPVLIPVPEPAVRLTGQEALNAVQEALNEEAERPPATRERKAPAGLQFYVDMGQFRDETRVSDITLDKCMIEQNGLRAYYGEQAARAEAQHARLKMRFDVLEATLYDQHRKAMQTGVEKVTEKAVENAVKTDPKWAKNKNTVIEAETIFNINRALVDSLRDRKDMIVQLAFDRRDESKGAARVLAQQDERESLNARALAAIRK